MDKYGFKRITDAVHGSIGLSELEVKILSSQAFQRLRRINQLGLAHLVFPGANYSRLSHSIGVCHVTGSILTSLRSYSGTPISDTEYQMYRLAGLLHDIGHFPFSHAFEDAVIQHYSNQAIDTLFQHSDVPDEPSNEQDEDNASLHHESVGKLVLTKDDELHSILSNHGVSPEEVYSIFGRNDPPRFANLISSDLDADRVDYLLRTASHTGLPYGSIDLDYLLSQMRLDTSGRICLTPKALRTAEHFLLGRYFDYQQVSYHKTVAAFEAVLKDIVIELLNRSAIDCSIPEIENMLNTSAWQNFDDLHIDQLIRQLQFEQLEDVTAIKVNSYLNRTSPKLVGSVSYIGNRDERREHERNVRDLNRIKRELAEEFDIDERLWYVWDSKGRPLTKVGAYASISMLPPTDDELEQSIRIINGDDSVAIVEVEDSLMRVLAQNALYSARLYVLLPERHASNRTAIEAAAADKICLDIWQRGTS